MSVLQHFSNWPALRWPWFVLASSSLILETTALYFQYAMGLEPCVMCIYQRLAIMGIAVSCLPALIAPYIQATRTLSFLGWAISAGWGAMISYEHVQMQNPANLFLAMSCDVIPNFPSWLPLHELLPSVFEARGTCGSIDWQLLGLSMPQWMLGVFSSYLLVLVLVLLTRTCRHKSL